MTTFLEYFYKSQIRLLQNTINDLMSRPISGNGGSGGDSFRPVESNLSDEDAWQQLGIFSFNGSSPLSSLTINISTSTEGIDIENASNLTSIVFISLTSITDSGYLQVSACSVLESIDLSLLEDCSTQLRIYNNTALTSLLLNDLATAVGIRISGNTSLVTLSLPALTSSTGSTQCSGNTSLTTFSASLWLPVNAQSIDFSNCALTAASVNHILARAVAASMDSGTIDLSGGTNAAPTGQGAADVITLTNAGVVVTTN